MDARRRALAVDFGLATAATLAGGLGVAVGVESLAGALALVTLGAVVLVVALSLAEHRNLLAVVDASRPWSLLAAFAGTLAVVLALVLGRVVVAAPAAGVLCGMGLGLAGYRLVFGVYRPLPPRRLAY
jgi:hypothetical protein